MGDNLLSHFMKGRPLPAFLNNVINNSIIENNVTLEGPLSLKRFVNLESLDISGHKITKLDVSDCPHIQKLCIVNNPFYGSLKPLRDFTYLKEIGIANTDVDSGLEYLPKNFFNFNATASDLEIMTGKLGREIIKNYKAREQAKQEELIEIVE
ncbi:hypothetical protein RhiirC2_851953 [Rhizophagus irregularis]|uniref:Uncharacterized protein n=1 Tax=Rhizophagus irregularis TaxID=588596 RepID=A0A2N1N1C4_9GLOM|nr:hypothetical protein RhiirC2_851953 [Rhizophagus irregularis]